MYWNIVQYLNVLLGVVFAAGTLLIIAVFFLIEGDYGLQVFQQMPLWSFIVFGFSALTVSITGFLMAYFVKLARTGQGFSRKSIKVLKTIVFLLFFYHLSHLMQPEAQTFLAFSKAGLMDMQMLGDDKVQLTISVGELMGVYTALLMALIVSLMVKARQLETENKQFI